MRLFVFLAMVCAIRLSDARIDNKFATNVQKQRHSIIHLDEGSDNTVNGEVKVKGHGRGSGRHNNGYFIKHHDSSTGEEDNVIDPPNHHGNDHHGKSHHNDHHQYDRLNEDHNSNKNKVAMNKDRKYEHSKWKSIKTKGQGKNLPARKVWRKVTNYKHKDATECAKLNCKRKHVCLVNGETGLAECIHRKTLRQWKKQHTKNKNPLIVAEKNRERKSKGMAMPKKHGNNNRNGPNKKAVMQHKRANKMAKKVKHKAEKFQHKYEEKKRHRLHHIQDVAHGRSNKHSMTISDLQTATKTLHSECSKRELSEMGRRLLDWFKLMQEKSVTNQPHDIIKRNTHKKELHEQDECMCQSPVRSEFLRLDQNTDNILSQLELSRLESNGYEHCIVPFIESCDHDGDNMLSTNEWCCCFSHVLPPCLAEMTKVPTTVSMGQKTAIQPGAFVPQCDEDGFYKSIQCHSSTGYCWCVDGHGLAIDGSHTRGTPNCDQKDFDISENKLDLE